MMKSLLSVKTTKHILPFFTCLLGYIAFTLLLRLLAPNGANLGAEKNLVFWGSLVFYLISLAGQFHLRAMIHLGAFLTLYLSTAFLQVLTHMTVNGKELVITLSFGVFLYGFYTTIHLLQNLFPCRWYRLAIQIISALLLSLLLLYPLCFWGYYAMSGQFLTVDIVLTLFQTNLSEALAFIKNFVNPLYAFAALLGTAALFTLAARQQEYILPPPKKRAFALIILLAAFSIAKLPAAMDCQAGSLILTTKYELEAYKNYGENQKKREAQLKSTASLQLTQSEKGIYLLVLGESQTRNHMQIYGYARETTPWLQKEIANGHLLLFRNAYSNTVSTVPTITYALSEKNQYNDLSLSDAYSLLEVAKAAGYKTYWLSNQFKWGPYDTPITDIAATAETQVWINNRAGDVDNASYYDEKLADVLPDLSNDTHALVVVHLMGCHWTYSDRYPKEFDRFHGGDDRVDTYDNAVLYTDHVLSRLVERLQTYPHFKGWVYMSDHGEDVDAHLGHNATLFTWPMARIPLLMSFSPSFAKENPATFRQLKAHTDAHWTNDLLYEAMTTILGIQGAPRTSDTWDIASPSYAGNPQNLKTLHGKKSLSEESQ